MHVLITADTVGGVWNYTRELVTGLACRSVQVTLVSLGAFPTAEQSGWLEGLRGVRYFATGFSLEWMPDSEPDLRESARYLCRIIEEVKPDLLHLSQFCYGALKLDIPKIVVAHSDVMSWSMAVRGEEPNGKWADWYRALVANGLEGATLVIAPSQWMLNALERCYGGLCRSQVIYNGRNPALFNPMLSKQNYAASAGRLWDEAKQVQLLTELERYPLPILVAGATRLDETCDESSNAPVSEPGMRLSTVRKEIATGVPGIHCLGQLSEGEIRELLSRASIYIAASQYEPFGLAPLEAALSRCAILANDIESLREIWGNSAMYFRHNDSESLRHALELLHRNPDLRLEYANRAYARARERYQATRMVEEYMQTYMALLERRVGAA